MSVSVFAPISIGNLSVGFDTLGLALEPLDGSLVGDIVRVEPTYGKSDENLFSLKGSHADRVPLQKEDNIVWRCLLAFEQALVEKQISAVPIHVSLYKNIPVSSGLGSSACSVVAAFVALNQFYQKPFGPIELLRMMGTLEAEVSGSIHYDNVAPCYMGGLQLMLKEPEQISQSLPLFDDCYWIIAYPDVEVSTRVAREILPSSYERKTLIEFGQNLAGFVDASHRKDKRQAFALMEDIIAEPYRAGLLPNYGLAKQALNDLGALAVGISGSGPTLFCVSDDLEIADRCIDWLQKKYLQSENGFVHLCKADKRGARLVR